MISLNVKVLSGLHTGAKWKYNDGSISIGGSSLSDIFLCDDGLPDKLITLTFAQNKLLISDASELIEQNEDFQKYVRKGLFSDQKLVLEVAGVQIEISVNLVSRNVVNWAMARVLRLFSDAVDVVHGLGIRLFVGLSGIFVVAITGCVLFLGTSGAQTSHAGQSGSDPAHSNELSTEDILTRRMLENIEADMKMFVQTNQLKQVRFSSTEKGLNIEGELSRLQIASVEKQLAHLASHYGQQLQIQAKLSLSEEQKIVDSLDTRSITFGSTAVLELRTNEQLFVGSVYQGLVVKEISPEKIVLQGDSEYVIRI